MQAVINCLLLLLIMHRVNIYNNIMNTREVEFALFSHQHTLTNRETFLATGRDRRINQENNIYFNFNDVDEENFCFLVFMGC